MAVLKQVYDNDGPPSAFEVSSSATTTIGRHEECNIIIDSPAVSRFHSHIICDNGRYFIEDLNSRNGTLLNGLPIRRRMLLSDGDQVEISTLPFTFLSQDSLAEASGSWGIKANVISISPVPSDEDSIRRQIVEPGDRISDESLGSDSVRHAQLVARISVADPGSGWPVISNATQKLNFTLRFMYSLRRTVHREEVIARSLQALFETFAAAERIAVVLKEQHRSGVRIEAAVSREENEEIEICLPVIRMCMQNSEALLYVDHWKAKAGEIPELNNPSLRSILAVPMIGLVGECLGVIQIDTTDQKSPLQTEDLELLVVLSSVISYALEQSRETEIEISNAVTERSTSDASDLRTSLMATSPPIVPGYHLANALIASPDVAADFIDYVCLPDGRVASFMIDVPGRGPSAANLMAVIARVLTESISETGSAAKAIEKAEHIIRERMTEIPLVTSVAIMILDTKRSSVTVSVVGHCPLYMLHGTEFNELQSTEFTSSPLGTERDSFVETELQLLDNDMLLLFSDGVTKLNSPAGELISREQIMQILEESAAGPRSALDSVLHKKLNQFRGESPLMDDVAFSMIHRTKNAATIDMIPPRMDSETMDA